MRKTHRQALFFSIFFLPFFVFLFYIVYFAIIFLASIKIITQTYIFTNELIVILNIILHNRERFDEDEEEYVQRKAKPAREKPAREKSLREKPVREKPVREKPVREKPVKEKPDRAYARMEEEDDASSFYAGDTQEIMT